MLFQGFYHRNVLAKHYTFQGIRLLKKFKSYLAHNSSKNAMNKNKQNHGRKKVLVYLVLVCSIIVPSIALALIMELGLLETLLVFFFPLISFVILFASFFFVGLGFFGLHHFVSLSLDSATSIPGNRSKPLPFYFASLIINFIFLTLVVFLSPQETLSIFPIFSSRQLAGLIRDLFTSTQNISQSITILLSFIIYPIVSGFTIIGVRLYRIYNYTQHAVRLETANNPGQKFIDSLKVLFYVSLILLFVSIYLGSFPSGYSLGDYCFWLFLVVIPGSIIGSWIGQTLVLENESAYNHGSRKLATLRIASAFLSSDSHDYEEPESFQLDFYEKDALDRLKIPTEPEKWKGKIRGFRTFKINQKHVLKHKTKILSFTKDYLSQPIESIGYTAEEEFRLKFLEESKTLLNDLEKTLDDSKKESKKD